MFFFLEKILKMDNGFSSEKKKQFELCGCICPCEEHDPKNNKFNYCKREVFHGKDIPYSLKGDWISPEGHVFNCNHPSGIYTIFLIDHSGPMGSTLIKPKRNDISQSSYHNNMLGASIEILLHFCRKRHSINRIEKCALIGYCHYASLIFTDIYVGEEDKIKKVCLSGLKADGGFECKGAFREAKKLLDDINNKKEYVPIIILLTCGDDFYPNETIDFVKNVS